MSFASQEYLSARVTLLAVRAAQRADAEFLSDRFLIGDAPNALPTHEAARALANVSKPAECLSQVESGLLRVVCQPITDPHELQFLRERDAFYKQRGGSFAFLRSKRGEDDEQARALCVGRDESLLMPLHVLRTWKREYRVQGGYAADVPGSMWADAQELTAEARSLGAVWIVKFFSSEESPSIIG